MTAGFRAWLGLSALGAALVAGCSASQAASGPEPAAAGRVTARIVVNSAVCGAHLRPQRPGRQTFEVTNQSSGGADVDLIDPANGAIYAEVEQLGPGTTRPMRLDAGSGSYAFRCLLQDQGPVTGPAFTVAGHVRGARAILPVTDNDLLIPAREYHAYVTAGLSTLVAEARTLDSDIAHGRLAAARAAWLPAHLTYERLGAAYGTFGTYDTEIDERPDGLAGGFASPEFTGFYRLEYGLWHGQPAAELTGPATRLYQDVRALQSAFGSMEISLLDVGLRTHEILENALQFQLTGHDDYGSGTTLATTAANIAGTRELLSILRPLLVPRYQDLPAVYTWLGRLQQLVDAQERHGTWTPVSKLGLLAREQINAAASQALQELAPIAVITEPRIT